MRSDGSGEVAVVVPVRGLRGGKTRLAGALPVEAREALVRRMLRGVVRAAGESGAVGTIMVVSPDADALAFAAELGASVVPLRQDITTPGLNAAAATGRDWARARQAAAVLVLLGDLPLLGAADVSDLVYHPSGVRLVLAPDRHGTGTNALLLRFDRADEDAHRFQFRFGLDSYAEHAGEAHRLGMMFATHIAPGTALDLDTLQDLQLLGDGDWMIGEGAEWLGVGERGGETGATPVPSGGPARGEARDR